jgi:type I restriction enzyme M protein
MRNIDGLQPQEAFDELLKYLFFRQFNEDLGPVVPIRPSLHFNGSFNGIDSAAAKKIRSLFRGYLSKADDWSTTLWKDKKFHLSDGALLALHELFGSVRFSSLGFDVRSNALKTFLTPELRRGLGIFLTPDEVARMVASVTNPKSTARVYDPACGSGTFLIEILRHWDSRSKKPLEIWGSDINPRMLLLAELNLGHLGNVVFHRQVRDALAPAPSSPWIEPNSFDLVVTNPPFGVSIDSAHYAFSRFKTCRASTGEYRKRQQSEVVFVEECLKLLKPGGTLAIVLPKSVITNRTLMPARQAIDGLGYVESVVSLPAETFASTGTQTTTSVLFFRKFPAKNSPITVSSVYADLKNVGYDSTGREREGNELPVVPDSLIKAAAEGAAGPCRRLPEVAHNKSLTELARLISGQSISGKALRLGDLLETITTGRTPARAAYTDAGTFIVKVGNLTGQGICWLPRDRNFISAREAEKRRKNRALMLKKNDLLLTSSAHSPKYIAKKIDIVTDIPLQGEATFVGEIMLLRPNPDLINPFLLFAYLRQPSIKEVLQLMVSGQTAHLMPRDVAELQVPEAILKDNEDLQKVAELLEEEAALSMQMNMVTSRIESILDDVTC